MVVDWDGDGLQDLVAGLADGRVQFLENTGTTSASVFASPVDLEVGLPGAPIDVVDRAMPVVADWNRDGRDDLLVRALDGKILVYVNEAASGVPDFQTELIVQSGGRTNPNSVPDGRDCPGTRPIQRQINLDTSYCEKETCGTSRCQTQLPSRRILP